MEILFYLMVFFLPYLEVPFLERIFILKLSNILAIIMMILLFRDFVLRKRRIELPFFLPLLIYTAVCSLSIIRGFYLPLEKGLEGAAGRDAPIFWSFAILFWSVFAFFVFWVTVNTVKRKEVLTNIIRVHLVSAGIVSAWGLWTVIGYLCGIDTGLKFTEVDWIVPRLSSTALEPLFFGNYLLSAIPLGLGLYLTKSDIFNQHLLLLLLIIQLFALILTFSVGAWVGLIIAFVFLAVNCFGKISWVRAGKLTLLLFVLMVGTWAAGSCFYSNIYNLPGIVVDKVTNIFKKTPYQATKDYNRVEFVSYDTIDNTEPGMYSFLKMKVKNTGTKTWTARGKNAVHLTYCWIGVRGEEKDMLRIRAWLPYDINPGESVALTACLRAPEIPGEYLLKWDMVEEYIDFFQEQGRSLPLTMKVKVSGPLRYYGAGFTYVGPVSSPVITNKKYIVAIKVKNTGTLVWNSGGKYPVHLSYRWFDRKGNLIPVEGLRTTLPRDILPGESVTLEADFEKYPGVPENSVLKWDMVRERVAWFSEQDRPIVYHKGAGKRGLQKSRINIGTITERWGLWRAGWNMFKKYPVIGVGLGNFSFLYNQYKPDDAVYKTLLPVINNVYLEILVETGILGMSAFLFFIFSVLKTLSKGIPKIEGSFERTVFFGLVGCLTGIAVQFNLCGGKTLHYIWILLGLVVAVQNAE